MSRTRKVKLIWILLKQETMSGSGINTGVLVYCSEDEDEMAGLSERGGFLRSRPT